MAEPRRQEILSVLAIKEARRTAEYLGAFS